MRDRESINLGEVLGHVSIKREPGADKEAIRVDAEKVIDEIKQKYLGTNNTTEMRREIHRELGDRLKNIPGVESVLIPTLLTANPSTITLDMAIHLDTGEITTDVGFEEGAPVKRPLWSRKRLEDDNSH